MPLDNPLMRVAEVTVLKHNPDTRYTHYKIFATKQEAIEFVQNLMPRIDYVMICRRLPDSLAHSSKVRSGYRGAVRSGYTDGEIITTYYSIVDKRDGSVIFGAYDGMPIWSADRAWAIIENMRVNGKPVDVRSAGSALPSYITMPIIAKWHKDQTIEVVDENGHLIEVNGKPVIADEGMEVVAGPFEGKVS
jgi:hypothetical protein